MYKRQVKDHLTPYLPENSFVIYNGLLPMRTTWQGKLDDNPFKFLFIGRLTPKKGLQVVLKALAAAKGDWILDVLGDGPLRKELESLTNELGLSDKVRFWGFREDTDDWLARCSCLLFPSFEEGMSMTLIRAVKMGVPVLASSIPSVKELCLNPETLIAVSYTHLKAEVIVGMQWGDEGKGRVADAITPKSDVRCV